MVELTGRCIASSVERFSVVPILVANVGRSSITVVGRIDGLAIKIVSRTVSGNDVRRLVDVAVRSGNDYLVSAMCVSDM